MPKVFLPPPDIVFSKSQQLTTGTEDSDGRELLPSPEGSEGFLRLIGHPSRPPQTSSKNCIQGKVCGSGLKIHRENSKSSLVKLEKVKY